MKFTAYQISMCKYSENTFIPMKNLDEKKLLDMINKTKKEVDEIGEFAIYSTESKDKIIVGVLYQSYAIDLSKFSDNSKEEIPIEESNAIDKRTYFFINCSKALLYVQNRRYSPDELSPILTFKRLQKLIQNCLIEDFEKILLFKAEIDYSLDEIEKIFRENFVRSVEFHNIESYKLEKNTKLHNPRIDLDEALIESWNKYSSENVETVKIVAQKGKSISKNPIANIGIKMAEQHLDNSGKIFKNMIIVESGQEVSIKQKGNEYFVMSVNDNNKTHSEVFEKILNYAINKV